MKLRSKFLLAMAAAFPAITFFLYFSNTEILLRGFARVEERDTRNNAGRARDAVLREIETLRLRSADWAAWDDSYQYVEDLNEEFARENLADETIQDLRVNALVFVNASGTVVSTKACDYDSGVTTDISLPFLKMLSPGSPLVTHPDNDHSLGTIVMLPEGPAIVSSRPILTTRHEGPSRGSLIWMRYLTENRFREMAAEIHLDLSVAWLDRPLTDPSWRSAAAQILSSSDPVLVRIRDGNTVDGFTVLNDMAGRPAILVRAAIPREIHQQAKKSARDLLLTVAVAGLAIFLLIAFAGERLLVSRLIRMGADVERIASSRDLSDRVHVEGSDELATLARRVNLMLSEIVVAQKSALDASRVKSQFLANVSHEIRTPLNGILGLTELAAADPSSPRQLEYLTTVGAAARSLLAIINDILDISRIEAGKLDIVPAPFRVRRLLDDAIAPMRPHLASKGLAHSVDVGADVPDAVLGDSLRLNQVLTNLLGNALKFTEAGSVTLRVRTLDLGDHDVRLRFEVQDTGIGIPADQHGKIFEAFTQADGTSTRRVGGTGLGLTISAHLVQLMGGRIEVESSPGNGSSFHFALTLPLATAPPPPPPPPAIPTNLPRMRVLVVEDNAVNRLVVERLLDRMGHEVVVVENGIQAVERTASEAFDAVLMDVQMPEMDGLEATRRIRARESAGGRRQPVIALTAHAMKGDEERCLASGMDAYLSKPLQSAALAAVLARVVSGRVPGKAAPSAQPAPVEAPAFSRAALLEQLGGDKALLREIAGIFVREGPALLEDVRLAIESTDCDRISRAAHRLKGSLLQLAAAPAAAAALAVEESGRAGNVGAASGALAELESEIRTVLRALTAEIEGTGARGPAD